MSKSRPSEEIQSLLDMLFVQDHDIFKGLHVNLRRSRLNGADLQGAHLEKAVLAKVYLQGADLSGAYLRGADLKRSALTRRRLERGALTRRGPERGVPARRYSLRGESARGSASWDINSRGLTLRKRATPRGSSSHGAQFQGANLSRDGHARGRQSREIFPTTYAQRMRARESDERRYSWLGRRLRGELSRGICRLSSSKIGPMKRQRSCESYSNRTLTGQQFVNLWKTAVPSPAPIPPKKPNSGLPSTKK